MVAVVVVRIFILVIVFIVYDIHPKVVLVFVVHVEVIVFTVCGKNPIICLE